LRAMPAPIVPSPMKPTRGAMRRSIRRAILRKGREGMHGRLLPW
jgi:hypothetical protein